MISLEEGVKLVWHALKDMVGGEIYVKKIKSMKIEDIAKCINPKGRQKIIGIRPGEKLHEEMISIHDAQNTYEYNDYYKILPNINNWNKDKKRIKNGKAVPESFSYSSENNKEWMIKIAWIINNKNKIDKFNDMENLITSGDKNSVLKVNSNWLTQGPLIVI